MKKVFNTYLILWIIMFVIFNAVTFCTPNKLDGETVLTILQLIALYEGMPLEMIAELSYIPVDTLTVYKFGGSFWIGYFAIVIAFLGHLYCGYLAGREENAQKVFYKISVVSVSYTGLVITALIGTICMYFPNMPIWVGSIICILTLVISLIAILRANAAAEIISDKDDEIKEKMELFKDLTQDAKQLYSINKDENIKLVYETLKYSDPMSNDRLYDIEKNIYDSFVLLKDKYKKGDDITNETKQLVSLIKERNEKCKALK